MAQRKTYRQSSSSRSRTTNRTSPSKRSATTHHNYRKSSGGNIGWVLLVVVLIVAAIIATPYIKEFFGSNSSDGNAESVKLGNLSQEEINSIVTKAIDDIKSKISITFTYNDKSWQFGAEELQATIDMENVINKAYESGREGYAIKQYQSGTDLTSLEQMISSSIEIDEQKLVEALTDVQEEIDNPVVEPTIVFDPSEYSYAVDLSIPETNMMRDMFTITEGQTGYKMDYEAALSQLNQTLATSWTATIPISVVEAHPTLTAVELEECTTLVYHSSSKISSTNRKDPNRNHNIAKAIGFYKGLVLMPGDAISYNETLGERTERSGWKEANVITQEKTLEKALGGGICQAATTIFNAAYMAGANIIDHGPHSWPAYHEDFGYGMDAMVNWSSNDDLIIKNDTDYPMYFNTYLYYNKYDEPIYVDVDVFSMPQKDENGTILHIRSDPNIDERMAPEPPTYIEDTEDIYADKTWKIDSNLNLLTYTKISPREYIKVTVDRVWYKDCVETSPGVFEGGVEVRRETTHTYTYAAVSAVIYTKPIPEAESTDDDASG